MLMNIVLNSRSTNIMFMSAISDHLLEDGSIVAYDSPSHNVQLSLNGFSITTPYPTIVNFTKGSGATGPLTNFVNYTPLPVASTYRLSGKCHVSSWTTPPALGFGILLTYKDDDGNSQNLEVVTYGASSGTPAQLIKTIDMHYFISAVFDINNSKTPITLSTSGQFTGSPVYNLTAIIERLH
jgi:hypothetical protein